MHTNWVIIGSEKEVFSMKVHPSSSFSTTPAGNAAEDPSSARSSNGQNASFHYASSSSSSSSPSLSAPSLSPLMALVANFRWLLQYTRTHVLPHYANADTVYRPLLQDAMALEVALRYVLSEGGEGEGKNKVDACSTTPPRWKRTENTVRTPMGGTNGTPDGPCGGVPHEKETSPAFPFTMEPQTKGIPWPLTPPSSRPCSSSGSSSAAPLLRHAQGPPHPTCEVWPREAPKRLSSSTEAYSYDLYTSPPSSTSFYGPSWAESGAPSTSSFSASGKDRTPRPVASSSFSSSSPPPPLFFDARHHGGPPSPSHPPIQERPQDEVLHSIHTLLQLACDGVFYGIVAEHLIGTSPPALHPFLIDALRDRPRDTIKNKKSHAQKHPVPPSSSSSSSSTPYSASAYADGMSTLSTLSTPCVLGVGKERQAMSYTEMTTTLASSLSPRPGWPNAPQAPFWTSGKGGVGYAVASPPLSPASRERTAAEWHGGKETDRRSPTTKAFVFLLRWWIQERLLDHREIRPLRAAAWHSLSLSSSSMPEEGRRRSEEGESRKGKKKNPKEEEEEEKHHTHPSWGTPWSLLGTPPDSSPEAMRQKETFRMDLSLIALALSTSPFLPTDTPSPFSTMRMQQRRADGPLEMSGAKPPTSQDGTFFVEGHLRVTQWLCQRAWEQEMHGVVNGARIRQHVALLKACWACGPSLCRRGMREGEEEDRKKEKKRTSSTPPSHVHASSPASGGRPKTSALSPTLLSLCGSPSSSSSSSSLAMSKPPHPFADPPEKTGREEMEKELLEWIQTAIAYENAFHAWQTTQTTTKKEVDDSSMSRYSHRRRNRTRETSSSSSSSSSCRDESMDARTAGKSQEYTAKECPSPPLQTPYSRLLRVCAREVAQASHLYDAIQSGTALAVLLHFYLPSYIPNPYEATHPTPCATPPHTPRRRGSASGDTPTTMDDVLPLRVRRTAVGMWPTVLEEMQQLLGYVPPFCTSEVLVYGHTGLSWHLWTLVMRLFHFLSSMSEAELKEVLQQQKDATIATPPNQKKKDEKKKKGSTTTTTIPIVLEEEEEETPKAMPSQAMKKKATKGERHYTLGGVLRWFEMENEDVVGEREEKERGDTVRSTPLSPPSSRFVRTGWSSAGQKITGTKGLATSVQDEKKKEDTSAREKETSRKRTTTTTKKPSHASTPQKRKQNALLDAISSRVRHEKAAKDEEEARKKREVARQKEMNTARHKKLLFFSSPSTENTAAATSSSPFSSSSSTFVVDVSHGVEPRDAAGLSPRASPPSRESHRKGGGGQGRGREGSHPHPTPGNKEAKEDRCHPRCPPPADREAGSGYVIVKATPLTPMSARHRPSSSSSYASLMPTYGPYIVLSASTSTRTTETQKKNPKDRQNGRQSSSFSSIQEVLQDNPKRRAREASMSHSSRPPSGPPSLLPHESANKKETKAAAAAPAQRIRRGSRSSSPLPVQTMAIHHDAVRHETQSGLATTTPFTKTKIKREKEKTTSTKEPSGERRTNEDARPASETRAARPTRTSAPTTEEKEADIPEKEKKKSEKRGHTSRTRPQSSFSPPAARQGDSPHVVAGTDQKCSSTSRRQSSPSPPPVRGGRASVPHHGRTTPIISSPRRSPASPTTPLRATAAPFFLPHPISTSPPRPPFVSFSSSSSSSTFFSSSFPNPSTVWSREALESCTHIPRPAVAAHPREMTHRSPLSTTPSRHSDLSGGSICFSSSSSSSFVSVSGKKKKGSQSPGRPLRGHRRPSRASTSASYTSASSSSPYDTLTPLQAMERQQVGRASISPPIRPPLERRPSIPTTERRTDSVSPPSKKNKMGAAYPLPQHKKERKKPPHANPARSSSISSPYYSSSFSFSSTYSYSYTASSSSSSSVSHASWDEDASKKEGKEEAKEGHQKTCLQTERHHPPAHQVDPKRPTSPLFPTRHADETDRRGARPAPPPPSRTPTGPPHRPSHGAPPAMTLSWKHPTRAASTRSEKHENEKKQTSRADAMTGGRDTNDFLWKLLHDHEAHMAALQARIAVLEAPPCETRADAHKTEKDPTGESKELQRTRTRKKEKRSPITQTMRPEKPHEKPTRAKEEEMPTSPFFGAQPSATIPTIESHHHREKETALPGKPKREKGVVPHSHAEKKKKEKKGKKKIHKTTALLPSRDPSVSSLVPERSSLQSSSPLWSPRLSTHATRSPFSCPPPRGAAASPYTASVMERLYAQLPRRHRRTKTSGRAPSPERTPPTQKKNERLSDPKGAVDPFSHPLPLLLHSPSPAPHNRNGATEKRSGTTGAIPFPPCGSTSPPRPVSRLASSPSPPCVPTPKRDDGMAMLSTLWHSSTPATHHSASPSSSSSTGISHTHSRLTVAWSSSFFSSATSSIAAHRILPRHSSVGRVAASCPSPIGLGKASGGEKARQTPPPPPPFSSTGGGGGGAHPFPFHDARMLLKKEKNEKEAETHPAATSPLERKKTPKDTSIGNRPTQFASLVKGSPRRDGNFPRPSPPLPPSPSQANDEEEIPRKETAVSPPRSDSRAAHASPPPLPSSSPHRTTPLGRLPHHATTPHQNRTKREAARPPPPSPTPSDGKREVQEGRGVSPRASPRSPAKRHSPGTPIPSTKSGSAPLSYATQDPPPPLLPPPPPLLLPTVPPTPPHSLRMPTATTTNASSLFIPSPQSYASSVGPSFTPSDPSLEPHAAPLPPPPTTRHRHRHRRRRRRAPHEGTSRSSTSAPLWHSATSSLLRSVVVLSSSPSLSEEDGEHSDEEEEEKGEK